MKQDEELTTKIEIESRIATRLTHINNAIDLIDLDSFDKEQADYIRNEIKLISKLVSKGMFDTNN